MPNVARPRIDEAVMFEIGRSLIVARKNLIEAMARPRFIADACDRYRIGQAEYHYKYEWLQWPEVTFEGETYVEQLDSVIYPAMASVARELRR